MSLGKTPQSILDWMQRISQVQAQRILERSEESSVAISFLKTASWMTTTIKKAMAEMCHQRVILSTSMTIIRVASGQQKGRGTTATSVVITRKSILLFRWLTAWNMLSLESHPQKIDTAKRRRRRMALGILCKVSLRSTKTCLPLTEFITNDMKCKFPWQLQLNPDIWGHLMLKLNPVTTPWSEVLSLMTLLRILESKWAPISLSNCRNSRMLF